MKYINCLKIKGLYLLGFVIIFFFSENIAHAQDQLVVKPVNAITNPLIDSLVKQLVGTGIKVQNIKSNLKQTSTAIGTFKAPAALMGGIKAGLVMVTGNATQIAGTNDNSPTMSNPIANLDTTTGINACPEGRQMLNSVLSFQPGTTVLRTRDVATIQFDVIPSADSIKFNYVFASEEYNTFVCSNFNDIFGFFISGPGIVGDQSLSPDFPSTKNLAIIPGTDLPVAINTVNDGTDPDPNGNCTITAEGTAAYIDNTQLDNVNPFIFQRLKFNGLTTVLTAAVKVVPCQTYTLTLTIADVQDGSWDSGVFIEKGSLRSGLTTSASSVYSTRFPYSIINCNPGTFIVKRDGGDVADRIVAKYLIAGTAVNGVDYNQRLANGTLVPLIDSVVLEPGESADTLTIVGTDGPTWQTVEQKSVILKFLNSILPYFNGLPNFCGDSSTMLIRKRFLYNAGPDKKVCQFSDTTLRPVSIPVLTDRYRWRELTANGDTIVSQFLSCDNCPRPKASNDTTKTYIVYVIDSLSGCVTNDTVVVSVENAPTLQFSSSSPDFKVCKEKSIQVIANPPTADPTWTYLWRTILSENTIEPPAIYTDRVLKIKNHNLGQYYVVTARNSLGCKKIDSVLVSIRQIPSFKLKDFDTIKCGAPLVIKPISVEDTVDTKFSWSSFPLPSDVQLLGKTSSEISINPTLDATYVLKGESSCLAGGFSMDSIQIKVIYFPDLSLTPFDTITCGESLVIKQDPPTELTDVLYSWRTKRNVDQNIIDSIGAQLTINPLKNAIYVVTGKSKCFAGGVSIDSSNISVIYQQRFELLPFDTLCYGTEYTMAPIVLGNANGTDFSWTSSDLKFKDPKTADTKIQAKASGFYVLTGTNACYNATGLVKDTIVLTVADSISAENSFKILNDGLTNVPVQFSSNFTPLTYNRIWKLKNETTNWDTTLLGTNPNVVITRGGDYKSEVTISYNEGSKTCSDTKASTFKVEPLGTVFIPTLVTDNNDDLNSVFLITARDENGKILREIKNGKLVLFNRWGKKVYENDNYDNSLNSSKLKEEVKDGTYFFEFSVERYNYKTAGWLSIQR